MLSKLSNIEAFIFDCDGVMTNGSAQIDAQGNALRTFNIKDGFAVQHAVKHGYKLGIISGGNNEGIRIRFKALGLKDEDIYLAQESKSAAFKEFSEKYHLEHDKICYMGDDLPDLPVLKKTGIAACPKDACKDVLEAADWVSQYNGGQGCAREIIELVMKIQGKWFNKELFEF